MAVPQQYLTSTKNLAAILDAIQGAKAPSRFTLAFLEGLGFKSSSDRLIIGVLKALGLLTDAGEPTDRYYAFLDKSRGKAVLADALRDAYADLFEVRKDAQNMSPAQLKEKLKTLTKGQFSDAVVAKMASTFKAMAGLADFEAVSEPDSEERVSEDEEEVEVSPVDRNARPALPLGRLEVGGLVYNIQIHLPESRDPAVYDALFRSLREHLFS